MLKEHVPLTEIQFVLIFLFFLYLYFRKRHRVFGTTAVIGFISLVLSWLTELTGGLKALMLILGLCASFVLSYKELEAYGKNGMDAKTFLNVDYIDIIILILFLFVWTVIKTIGYQ